MFPLAKLHALAAARGDGLRSEILDEMERRASLARSNAVDLSAHLPDSLRQAGPNPAGKLVLGADNVVLFRKQ